MFRLFVFWTESNAAKQQTAEVFVADYQNTEKHEKTKTQTQKKRENEKAKQRAAINSFLNTIAIFCALSTCAKGEKLLLAPTIFFGANLLIGVPP